MVTDRVFLNEQLDEILPLRQGDSDMVRFGLSGQAVQCVLNDTEYSDISFFVRKDLDFLTTVGQEPELLATDSRGLNTDCRR